LALAYQVRATRDYLQDLHPQNAEVSHLMEVVRLADAVQQGGARSMLEPPLLAYAFWLEEDLKLADALDVVETALGLNDGTSPTEEIAALLQRARVLRLMGQFDDARTTYESAKSRAVSVGDTHSSLLARIGDAIVMRQLGNLPASEEALEGILREAERLADRDVQARAHHDLAAALMHMEQTRRAIEHLYKAFELYQRLTHRLRALSDLGEALRRAGQLASARDAFTFVLRSGGTEELRAAAMIALLEVSAQVGDRVGFANWKREIRAVAENLPADRQVLFHLQLGLGYAAFGQVRTAERSLRRAQAMAEEHQLNEYAFKAEAALSVLTGKSAPGMAEVQAAPRAEAGPELAAIAEKLHALQAS
jgi:tetratricopeptide (TPR) repeat protein